MRNSKILIFILVLFFFQFANISKSQVLNADRNQFTNLLKPDGEYTFFADLGSWHSYSFPISNDEIGGFTGPFLIDTNDICVSKGLARFIAIEAKDTLVPKKLEDVKLTYFPGKLQQEYEISNLKFTQQLEFADNRSTIIQYKIKNNSTKARTINILWYGNISVESKLASLGKRIEFIISNNGKKIISELISKDEVNFQIIEKGKSYIMKISKPVEIQPGKEINYTIHQTYLIDKKDESQYKFLFIDNPEKISANNQERWNKYISNVLNRKSKWLKEEKYRRVAVKAIITLVTNWRSAAGYIYHDGICPSISVNYFNGFWAWDSWKHAAACALFAPELGKSNIEAMFDYQDKNGMIEDCIFVKQEDNNYRNSKPPLSVWAVWEIYTQTKDLDFLKKIFPKLVKYHEWWYKFRDNDKNGLCEFGSTDGTLEAAAWESGMDNAVRYDDAKMIKNSDSAWSINQESVDLNSFLYLEKTLLAKIMDVLGDNRKDAYLKEAEKLKNLINQSMYNKELGFYFDVKIDDKKQITLFGSEGWHPLWAGIADKEQAQKVSLVMTDTNKFNKYMPLTTFQADNPKFDPIKGYWRGPIWLDQVYFGIEGLKKYGFYSLADSFIEKTISNAEGMLGDGSFRENYNPLNGTGLKAQNFSWSAACVLMMLCAD